MDVAYVAHTESSTLLLDAEGMCLRVQSREGASLHSDGAVRCIGAQYVASLDLTGRGGLLEKPRAGCPMLFAACGADGRIYVIRTGPIVLFEEVSGVHDRYPPPPALDSLYGDGAEEPRTTPFRIPETRPETRAQPAHVPAAHRTRTDVPPAEMSRSRPLYVPPPFPDTRRSREPPVSAPISTPRAPAGWDPHAEPPRRTLPFPFPSPFAKRRLYSPPPAPVAAPAPLPPVAPPPRHAEPLQPLLRPAGSLEPVEAPDDSSDDTVRDSISPFALPPAPSSAPTSPRHAPPLILPGPRPPSPSSHAWLRNSPAAVRASRRR